MAPTIVLRFRDRGGLGTFPKEPIAVPRTLMSVEFDVLQQKLMAEFWPAVKDDVDGVPDTLPAGAEAQSLVVNGVRAPKCGTLADIVMADEDLDICIQVKGVDEYSKLWIPEAGAGGKKKKGAAVKAEGEDGAAPTTRRKIKRWDEKETQLLISLVKENGKGKWKRVLEMGAGTFDEHRTTVDLKDKWRNLERSGLAPAVAENPDIKRNKKAKKEEAAAPAVTSVPAGSHLEALTGTAAPPEIVGGFAAAVGGALEGGIGTDPVLGVVTDFGQATQPVAAAETETKTRPQRGRAAKAK